MVFEIWKFKSGDLYVCKSSCGSNYTPDSKFIISAQEYVRMNRVEKILTRLNFGTYCGRSRLCLIRLCPLDDFEILLK